MVHLSLPKITSPKPSIRDVVIAAAVAGPVGAAAVLAYDHKDQIKSTLAPVADAIKKDAGVAAKDTLSVAKDAGNGITSTADTVGTDIKKGASAVGSGMENMYWYGMAGAGVLIALKISGVF